MKKYPDIRFIQLKSLTRFIFFMLYIPIVLQGNPIISEPVFPTQFDSIIVFYHAELGNGSLEGTDDTLYAHTGVITDKSSGPSDWKYVVTPWPGEGPDANQAQNRLERLDTNLYKLVIGYPSAYYEVPEEEQILKLAFVFRNQDGTLVGRDSEDKDIFLPLYEAGLTSVLIEPEDRDKFGHPDRNPLFLNSSDTLSVRFTAAALGVDADSLVVLRNGKRLFFTVQDTLNMQYPVSTTWKGRNLIQCVSLSAEGISDTLSFTLFVDPVPHMITKPSEIRNGVYSLDAGSALFSLMAPNKRFVYLLGDFNDWKVNDAYLMNKSIEGDKTWFWLPVNSLTPGMEYAYQYLVDGKIRVADPYAVKILDEGGDPYIPEANYPNLKPYPKGKTEHIVSVFEPFQDMYEWQHENYSVSPQTEWVIYELLVRDFLEDRSYTSLIDSLSYLKKLGVNAIQLMPVIEFGGNDSWGYNPTFFFAPDKAYGTGNDLKAFIDSCHGSGIAVILDIVLNHAFGDCPFVRLYNEGDFGAPLPESPWFNVSAPHPMSVGYDFNHESPFTKELMKEITAYWMEEYHVDGYRFDLSKGFTQTYSGDDVGAWSRYDQSRIDILNEYASHIRSVKPDAALILEHFADNDEEKTLAHNGFMLWGNMNGPYSQAAMSWLTNSDFSYGYFRNRGWWAMNLVTFMESHDEPWIMYKNLQYGNCMETYCIRDTVTALKRMELSATFFLTLPGPKMIWQFGELGYDRELPEEEGRTEAKPVLWHYLKNTNRVKLFNVYKNLLKLRKDYPLFRNSETTVSIYTPDQVPDRRLKLSSPEMNAVILGNFGMNEHQSWPEFHHTGSWYEFFSGDTLSVDDTGMTLTLQPGEYRLYTDQKLFIPDTTLPVSLRSQPGHENIFRLVDLYPNPFNAEITVHLTLPDSAPLSIQFISITGKTVGEFYLPAVRKGIYSRTFNLGHLPSGVYLVNISQNQHNTTRKLVLLK
jgi:1,4-alpha-glucan branching enzyme